MKLLRKNVKRIHSRVRNPAQSLEAVLHVGCTIDSAVAKSRAGKRAGEELEACCGPFERIRGWVGGHGLADMESDLRISIGKLK